MSRIGNRALKLPEGLNLEILDDHISIQNSKSQQLKIRYNKHLVRPQFKDGVFTTQKVNNSKQSRAQFGTINALVNNAMKGLVTPFTKNLEIVGVGYKASMEGNKLKLALGYSHPILMEIRPDVQVKTVSSLEIELSSYNKEALGAVASQIREFRPPEPYKGKGVKYKDEVILRKVGKTSEGSKK